VDNGSNGEVTLDDEAAMTSRNGDLALSGADLAEVAEVIRMRGERVIRPVSYVVLPNAEAPFLLARARWPDVYQAISAVRTDWQDDPGLFDLPYAPASVHVSFEEACEIAQNWGARIPDEDGDPLTGPSLIRRMPSDWSSLSTAERRAWSIEIEKPARRALADAAAAAIERSRGPEVAPVDTPTPTTSPVKPRRWGRRKSERQPVMGAALIEQPGISASDETLLIDLTDGSEVVGAAAESA
jgi:hypothetical protein